MSNISAGTSTLSSLTYTGDTTGNLELQSNGVTVATVASSGFLVTGNLTVSSKTSVGAGTATTAGGSATSFMQMGTTAGLGIYFGSGLPTITAAQGSLYIRSDGSSTSTRMYINTTGSTVWTNVVTAA
jgi:hypothetical protein